MKNLPDGDEPKVPVVQANAELITGSERIVRFNGRALLFVDMPYPHFIPLQKDTFDQFAYPLLGGMTRSRMNDVFSFVTSTAPDLTPYRHRILFGIPHITHPDQTDYIPLEVVGKTTVTVWDTLTLHGAPWFEADPEDCVWRSPYQPTGQTGPVPFILELAGGDVELYEDIIQSIAPLIMGKKPDGNIWWVGDGANGKSTLMYALHKLFPGQLSSLTVKQLTDGRDTPTLNGVMGNVVKESSEGRIDDTQVYKSIGTHEDFPIHKFHSQDGLIIDGNKHHIFSGNSIPIFNDKGHSARRRTFIIPFNQTFESNPDFERQTFTPEVFGHLISEMMRVAVAIRDRGYRYKWSAMTLGAKADYDLTANSAEAYAHDLVKQGVVAFNSFHPVKMDYENWCADEGLVPLGIQNLTKALKIAGYERMSVKHDSGKVTKHYRLATVGPDDLLSISPAKPGMFTAHGFQPDTPSEDKPPTTMTPPQPPLGEGRFKW